MSDENQSKLGRPTDYRPEYNEQAYKLCLLGATDAELGNFFGVTEQTINNWKVEYPPFFESIKNGKEKADADVANSLYKRACGYEHPEDHITSYEGEITVTPTIKHYPPDTGAAMAWLKNRTRGREKPWKDDYAHDVKGSITLADIAARMGAGTDAAAPQSEQS